MNVVAAELRKLTGIPSVGVMVVLCPAVAAVLVAAARHAGPDATWEQLVAPVLHLALGVSAATGAVMAGQDHRAGQLATGLLAVPRRPVFVLGRTVAWSLLAVFASATTVAVAVLLAGGDLSAVLDRLPSIALLTGTTLAAAFLTDLFGSALGGACSILAVLWAAPLALGALPEVRKLLPAAAVGQLEAGTWADHPWPAICWLAGSVAAGAVVLCVRPAASA